MDEAVLHDRDYTVIIARPQPITTDRPPLPDLEERWQLAETAIARLAQKCEELDPDGITLYIATTPLIRYSNATGAMVAEILAAGYLAEQPDLFATLKVAIADYFERKEDELTKANGEIIAVFLDGEPCDRGDLVQLLVKTSRQMDRNEELGIVFAQVGDDMVARGFLQALDDDLKKTGAKFDLVDSRVVADLQGEEITQFLFGAIYD
ncbi:von Willebrand factor type A [Thalassoporum mexicanum PCC 7367]|uniref:hypothetical protein n=1 Tax=Thalassoporum mexicanum TaxID=3457544 RepID=UPI00029F9109|nr:hypothetical protein [Pseudanabaena sp. PCC 7367]AFY69991.1 von Willebrand factor type A [Pseudanabaena sp. PCC 7367]